MKALIGTKVGMTNLFDESGKVHAVTIVYVEPNRVLEVKTKQDNGYDAIKLGYEDIKEKNVSKPKKGQFKKYNCNPKRYVKEFRNVTQFNVGDDLKVDIFKKGEYVDVQGTSKGHGFTGSIKRHNFAIGPLGHGAGYPHRYVGSISGGRGGSQAQRVFKGTELPGHYGHEVVTMQNLLILDIDVEKNILLIKGAIPGNKKDVVYIKLSKKKADKSQEIKLVSFVEKKTVQQQEPTTNPVENNQPLVAEESNQGGEQ